jgi:hypothetical protein
MTVTIGRWRGDNPGKWYYTQHDIIQIITPSQLGSIMKLRDGSLFVFLGGHNLEFIARCIRNSIIHVSLSFSNNLGIHNTNAKTYGACFINSASSSRIIDCLR